MNKNCLFIFTIFGLLTNFQAYAIKEQFEESYAYNHSRPIQAVNYLQQNISISRALYINALLEKVMDVTKDEYGPYTINTIKSDLVPRRKEIEMLKGDKINLMWSTEDNKTVQKLIKVPFHTMKGILGNRVLLIRKERQSEFNKITNLEQLQQLKPGQVKHWVDTLIYTKNNFNVVTAQKMTSLFPMLENSRFDFLPLGASEVNQEYSHVNKKHPSLAIEKDLLIKYALHVLLMVSPTEPTLAQRLEKGLLTIEKNGEFDRIFNKYIQPDLDSIQIQNRKVIQLKNPTYDK